MLCCSLVALLALILCEVSFLPTTKGNSPWQDKPGSTGGENQKKIGSKTGVEFSELSRRETAIRANFGARFRAQATAEPPRLRNSSEHPFLPSHCVPAGNNSSQNTSFSLQNFADAFLRVVRRLGTKNAREVTGQPRKNRPGEDIGAVPDRLFARGEKQENTALARSRSSIPDCSFLVSLIFVGSWMCMGAQKQRYTLCLGTALTPGHCSSRVPRLFCFVCWARLRCRIRCRDLCRHVDIATLPS